MRLLWILLPLVATAVVSRQQTPEQRAVEYLAGEVRSWSPDNNCFSCHNNGDAARALYVARRMSYEFADSAVADTTQWLSQPELWDDVKGSGFSDKRLARIEFANSLLEAIAAGVVTDRSLLHRAIQPLLASQDKTGAWTVDAGNSLALPATYGPVLATYMARRVMEQVASSEMADAIGRANDYLIQAPTAAVVSASAVIMSFARNPAPRARAKLNEALNRILLAQSATDGGWGPYPGTPTEHFDSALALLALSSVKDRPGVAERIQRGRQFLISNQLRDGGWTETTRPAGGRSYAEHISTSGWATLALLETR